MAIAHHGEVMAVASSIARGVAARGGCTWPRNAPIARAASRPARSERWPSAARQATSMPLQQLITANLGLVLRAVSDYKQCGVPLDDLIQEGNLGLIRAARHFDPSTHTARFATYATYWIRCFIVRALASNGSLIQRPENVASSAPAISQGGRRASCARSRRERRARLEVAQSRRGCQVPRGPAAPARGSETDPERPGRLPEPGRSDAGRWPRARPGPCQQRGSSDGVRGAAAIEPVRGLGHL